MISRGKDSLVTSLVKRHFHEISFDLGITERMEEI